MRLTKKGIIFSLDAALAISVVLIMLINSSYYLTTSSRESISQIQLLRAGYDILAVFDLIPSKGYADLSRDDPKTGVAEIPPGYLNVTPYLPENYNMSIMVTDLNETLTNFNTVTVGGGLTPGQACDVAHCNVSLGVEFSVSTLPVKVKGGNFVSFASGVFNTTAVNGTIIVTNMNTSSRNYTRLVRDTRFVLVGPLQFVEGVNWLNVSANGTVDGRLQVFNVSYLRVVGDESYAGFTSRDVPNDRYVGAGERVFIGLHPDGQLEGVHIARFYIWVVGNQT